MTNTATATLGLGIDRTATGYDLFPARKYEHVAAILSNGQRTARYSRNRETGTWYWQEGWKRVGRRLPAEIAAYAERIYLDLTKCEAKVVTGRDADGTTYDHASARSFTTLDEAATAVAQATNGHTWDVFDAGGARRARVHADGGVDSYY